jgi:molecular chaperone HtpG
MSQKNFQVNLQGIIDLLSNHLYSDPGVFVRELLQNGVDAITARKRLGDEVEGKVVVEIFSADTISVYDNGCGLTEEQIEQFLARIGSSTKRDELDAPDDFIGQFGVGLLSCFVVSDEIVVITRSAAGGAALEWRGKPDGTYQLKQIKRQVPVGTTVFLKAKPDYEDYFMYYRLSETMEKYGQYLPIPIHLVDGKDDITLNEQRPVWKMDKEEAFVYLENMMYRKPMDVIPLRSLLGGVEGVAYILPYAVSLQEEKKHRVYLKNMLLSDKLNNILPPWAFFVNAILNTDSLKPTASRESFQENDLFFNVQEELGQCIKQYLLELAERDPALFKRVIIVHYASIKAMAAEDEQLYELFIRHLSFETSEGTLETAQLLQKNKSILITTTIDEFRQIARVAKAQELLVVNGGYVHDLELICKLPDVMPDVQVTVLDVLTFASRFAKLDAEDKLEVQDFVELSDQLLERFQCRALVRWFEPADLPVLYTTNQEVNFLKLAEEAQEQAGELFGEFVHVVRSELYEQPFSQLCYNYNNPIVRKAAASNDQALQQVCIELFYTQALLMGHHPLGPEELRLMNASLLQFMNLGLETSAGDGR